VPFAHAEEIADRIINDQRLHEVFVRHENARSDAPDAQDHVKEIPQHLVKTLK
jgi:hypothetical protein